MCQCPLTMSARCVGSHFCPAGSGGWSPQPGWPHPSPTRIYGVGGQVDQPKEIGKFLWSATPKPPPGRNQPKGDRRPLQASHRLPPGLGLWAGSRAWEEAVSWGKAWKSSAPGTGARSGSIQAAGLYRSFTPWVQTWVKMSLLLARSHRKRAAGKEAAQGIPLKMLKDCSWRRNQSFRGDYILELVL